MLVDQHFANQESEQTDKFVGGEAGPFKNGGERTTIEVPAMEKNDHETWFGFVAKETMRAGRVVQIKARFEESPNDTTGRTGGQARHESLDVYFEALKIRGPGFNRDLLAMF